MDISQKRFSNQTGFKFQEDSLEYTVKDNSGRRTFTVEYAGISTDSGEIEERNAWYRNVGFFWVLIGAFSVFSHFTESGEIRGSIWLTLGVICFALYGYLKTTYTTLDSEKGQIFIIKDSKHDDIESEIESRRKNQWFRWYGSVDYGNEPNSEIGKFQWLLDRDAISQDQFTEFRAQILDYHSSRQAEGADDERTLN